MWHQQEHVSTSACYPACYLGSFPAICSLGMLRQATVDLAKRINPLSHSQHRETLAACETVLTGDTLHASLKLRADTSNAAFVIYWVVAGDHFVVGGDYEREDFGAIHAHLHGSYAESSMEYRLDKDGTGPIASAYRDKKGVFVPNASACEAIQFDGKVGCEVTTLKRLELAKVYRISSVAFMPFEMGVLEFGTCHDLQPDKWFSLPQVPTSERLCMWVSSNVLRMSYPCAVVHNLPSFVCGSQCPSLRCSLPLSGSVLATASFGHHHPPTDRALRS